MRWPILWVCLGFLISCALHDAAMAQPAGGQAAQPAEPKAKAKPPRRTGHDEYAATLAFNRRTLVEAYEQAGRRDPKWDEPAKAFLESMARHFTMYGRHEMYWPEPPTSLEHQLALGRKAIDAGCDDPLVLYCYFVPLENKSKEEALSVLRRAHEGLKSGNYPPLRVY